jgi:tetraacyldisaccharide 4'-kinase
VSLWRTPGFWREDGLVPRLLSPIAAVWGAVAARRMAAPARARADLPVIVVGNLTAGGAGKTPTVIALVDRLRRLGFRPAVLSRGYGGADPGPLRVDVAADIAARVGDEPLLLAAHAPTIVARDRAAGLPLVGESGADVLVLDDGFQTTALEKDLRIVVVDAGAGIGNGRVLPAGPLRAPLDRQLDRTDLLVVIDSGEASAPSTLRLVAEARRRGLPVVAARLVARAPETVAGRRVLAHAGIGRPEKFAAGLAAAGAHVVALEAFADHRPLGRADAERLLARAAADDLLPVTTEKDAARARGAEPAVRRLFEASIVFPVDLVFEQADAVDAAIAAASIRFRARS